MLSYINDSGLSLGKEKTEIILLTRRKNKTILKIGVKLEVVGTKPTVKYLKGLEA